MSPKFYFSLWMIFAAAAAVVWLSGTMTLLAIVTFGFISFGLTFVGMMCVLPSVFAHEHEIHRTKDALTRETQKAGSRSLATA